MFPFSRIAFLASFKSMGSFKLVIVKCRYILLTMYNVTCLNVFRVTHLISDDLLWCSLLDETIRPTLSTLQSTLILFVGLRPHRLSPAHFAMSIVFFPCPVHVQAVRLVIFYRCSFWHQKTQSHSKLLAPLALRIFLPFLLRSSLSRR